MLAPPILDRPMRKRPSSPFDITDALQHLVVVSNVLAIHGLNRSIRSSFFVAPGLVVQQPGDVVPEARFFESPTPGEANGDQSYGGVLRPVEISLAHGFTRPLRRRR